MTPIWLIATDDLTGAICAVKVNLAAKATGRSLYATYFRPDGSGAADLRLDAEIVSNVDGFLFRSTTADELLSAIPQSEIDKQCNADLLHAFLREAQTSKVLPALCDMLGAEEFEILISNLIAKERVNDPIHPDE